MYTGCVSGIPQRDNLRCLGVVKTKRTIKKDNSLQIYAFEIAQTIRSRTEQNSVHSRTALLKVSISQQWFLLLRVYSPMPSGAPSCHIILSVGNCNSDDTAILNGSFPGCNIHSDDIRGQSMNCGSASLRVA